MATRDGGWKKGAHWVGRVLLLLVLGGGATLAILWLAGKFEPKVPVTPGETAARALPPAGEVVAVRRVRLPLSESAVGTIRAVHETSIGSKLLARVVEVNVRAGQTVSAGDVLVRLDDTDLQARLQQARAALDSAQIAREQAASDQRRSEQMLQSRATSRQAHEQTVTALRAAEAELRRAEEAVNEAQAALEWATIAAPMSGIVIEKQVEVGDTATPGQVLVTLFDPTRMQLVANVRESLAQRLQVGQPIEVRVQGLDKQCVGQISEIVPQAQAASRAFQVKVTGPCPRGIYSGMFGRILIPLDEEEILLVPREAVRHVGQLELVEVVAEGRVTRRAVRTGRRLSEGVEILSGLSEGEQVVVPGDRQASCRPLSALAPETHHG